MIGDFFLHQRLIFNKAHNPEFIRSSKSEIQELRDLLKSSKSPSLSQKKKIKKHLNSTRLSPQEKAAFSAYIESEKSELIAACKKKEIGDNDKELLMNTPLDYAFSELPSPLFPKFINHIRTLAKNKNFCFELKSELDVDFLNKTKAFPVVKELHEEVRLRLNEDFVEESSRKMRDSRELSAIISDIDSSNKTQAEKHDEIISAISGVLSDEHLKEAKKLLQLETYESKQAFVDMIQQDAMRKFKEALSDSVEQAQEILDDMNHLITKVLILVFGEHRATLDLIDSANLKDSNFIEYLSEQEFSHDHKEIFINYLKKSQIRSKQLDIIRQSETESEIAEKLNQNKWIQEEEYELAKKIHNRVADFKSKLARFQLKKQELKKELSSLHEAGARSLLHNEDVDISELQEIFGLKDHIAVRDEQGQPIGIKELKKELAHGISELDDAFFNESEELSSEYGLMVDELVNFDKLNLASHEQFLEKTLDSNEREIFANSEFLQDFFSKKSSGMQAELLRRLFYDAKKDESEALSMLFAESNEVLSEKFKKLKQETNDANSKIFELKTSLQDRLKLLNERNAPNEAINETEDAIRNVAQIPSSELDTVIESDPLLRADLSLALDSVEQGLGKNRDFFDQIKSKNEALAKPIKPISIKEIQEDRNAKCLDDFINLKNSILKGSVDIEFIKRLKNPDGSDVFCVLPNEQFEKKYGHEAKAFVDFKNSTLGQKKLHLYVKEAFQDNSDIISHEAVHIVDFLSNKKLSKAFYKEVHARLKDDLSFQRQKKAFEKIYAKEDLPDEILAHYLAGDTVTIPVGAMIRLIKQYFSQSELDLILEGSLPTDESFRSSAGEHLNKNSFFASSEQKFAKGSLGVEIKNKNPLSEERYNKQRSIFENKKTILNKKLENIAASKDVTDRDIFIAKIKDYVAQLEDMAKLGEVDESTFVDINSDMTKLADDCSGILARIAEECENSENYFMKLYNETTFVSMADMKTIWSTFMEYMERKHQRNSKARAGAVGSAVFDGINAQLASEYDLLSESAEKEEVSKYEDALSNKDAWQIYDVIEKTNNKDELKACLGQLANIGRINWRDERLWGAFHRLQSSVCFRPSDGDDLVVLYQKLNKVITSLYDGDTFSEWERLNNSNLDSKKSEYKRDAINCQNYLTNHVKKMLTDTKKGKKVDPHRYEMFLDYAIEAGKMDVETMLYYLIQGVYEGILSPERPVVFAGQSNNVPPLELIDKKKPTIEEWCKWGAMFETSDGSVPSEYIEWFHVNWMTEKSVYERTFKSAGQMSAKWDHDWMQMIAAIGSTSMASNITSKIDGTPKYQATAYPNALNGILHHFTSVARHKEDISYDDLKEEFARQMGYAMNLEGILFNKVKKGDYKLFRFSADDINYPPRADGYGAGLSTGQTAEHLREITRAACPEFFNELFSKKPDFDKLKNILENDFWFTLYDPESIDENGKLTKKDINDIPEGSNPANIDWYYEFIHTFTQRLFEHDPDRLQASVDKCVKLYADDHKGQKFRKWDWSIGGRDDVKESGGNPYMAA
ncbi:MAG: hypothetical protein N4A36_01535 [Candidatus Gracilibacteria bacterium]|jgi:hypothetical protein|nr:hypothetical protein [Candidatus Gracilibacteria bacterium]